MRLGLWSLGAVFLGAFGAHFWLPDRGYVMIGFRSYVVEMSVPALILVLIVLYALVRVAVRLWRVPRAFGRAVADRRLRHAGEKLTSGLIQMTEGEFNRSERLLTQGLKGTDAPLVNYLLAARAAQAQGSLERRNEWLSIAFEESPAGEAAVLLTQAELQLEAAEDEPALATLQKLLDIRADHPVALGLLARTLRRLGDYGRLLELLPKLRTATLAADELVSLTIETLDHEVGRDALELKRLDEIWMACPPAVRKAPPAVACYARALQRLGQGERAEKQLKQALKRHWHPALVEAYGLVEADDCGKQLKQAEQWLKQHPEDAQLLLATARLCMANELWGKARSYLESSLALASAPRAYALYGHLLDRLGEGEQAAMAYHSGLSLVSGLDPERPALGAPRLDDDAADA